MPVAQTESQNDALSRLRIRHDDPPQRRSAAGRFLRVLMVIVVISGCGLSIYVFGQNRGWFPKTSSFLTLPAALQSRPEVRVVRVVVERGRAADALVVATGYLESRRQAKIGARAPGRIDVVNVEEGSRVTEDDILAILEHADMDAALAAANATLARARAELAEQEIEIQRTALDWGRAEELRPSGSITEAEYDTANFQHQAAVARKVSLNAAIDLADARVRESEQLKENMFIRAPFDGTVISKDAEVGESILPGGMGEASGRGSVVTIADLQHLEVDCAVKEDYISRVHAEQLTEVSVDAVPDKRYRGRVRKIIPMGDRARATVRVKVEILDADERLFPDMSSTVYFLPDATTDESDKQEPRMFCPSTSLVTTGDQSGVWVVNADNQVTFTAVTLGESRDGRTEIHDGLSGGDIVIARPPDGIRDGDTVRTIQ
jgi:HlyD family secretion protein